MLKRLGGWASLVAGNIANDLGRPWWGPGVETQRGQPAPLVREQMRTVGTVMEQAPNGLNSQPDWTGVWFPSTPNEGRTFNAWENVLQSNPIGAGVLSTDTMMPVFSWAQDYVAAAIVWDGSNTGAINGGMQMGGGSVKTPREIQAAIDNAILSAAVVPQYEVY